MQVQRTFISKTPSLYSTRSVLLSGGGITRPVMLGRIRGLMGVQAHQNTLSVPFLSKDEEYTAPAWATHLGLKPMRRVGLGLLPTPIHRWHLPGLPEEVEVYVKRDDMSGHELSGNKVRKLEFLLAEAVAGGHDCVVTIGGIQSNHCRATAVAARYLGLDCHLVLRTSRSMVGADPGLVGNLLLDRLSGAHVHLVTKEEYASTGGQKLGEMMVAQLKAQGLNPYLIPVGGSNALGTWGYLQAVEEIRQQTQGWGITDIAMACGSGGTTAGIALGSHLAGLGAKVHAYGVCDSPDYFYDFVDHLVSELGVGEGQGEGPSAAPKDLSPLATAGAGSTPAPAKTPSAREMLRVVQAKGLGYAMSTEEELHTVKDVAQATGICLDPVYSGKALHAMLAEIKGSPQAWAGRKVLFVHTGGLLGMFDKLEQLSSLFTAGTSKASSGGEDAGVVADATGTKAVAPPQQSAADKGSGYGPHSRVYRMQLK